MGSGLKESPASDGAEVYLPSAAPASQRLVKGDQGRPRLNKWIGLTRGGKPFTVHVKHGTTRNYPSRLVEAVARDLRVTPEEFSEWYKK